MKYGPQEPPKDDRIFNQRHEDGTFPPLTDFFDGAARKVLESRRKQIIVTFETTLFSNAEQAAELISELAEIETALGKL